MREDGTKYVGEWWNEGRNGRGTIHYSDRRTYEGEWSDPQNLGHDAPDGTGVMTWPDGKKYDGDWKSGKMHGVGIMTFPDGTKKQGLWRNDEFIGSVSNPE